MVDQKKKKKKKKISIEHSRWISISLSFCRLLDGEIRIDQFYIPELIRTFKSIVTFDSFSSFPRCNQWMSLMLIHASLIALSVMSFHYCYDQTWSLTCILTLPSLFVDRSIPMQVAFGASACRLSERAWRKRWLDVHAIYYSTWSAKTIVAFGTRIKTVSIAAILGRLQVATISSICLLYHYDTEVGGSTYIFNPRDMSCTIVHGHKLIISF